jgi:hypothetical protein
VGLQLAAQLANAGTGRQPEGLLFTKVEGSQFTAAGRSCGDVVEEGAELLVWIKDK